jgi:hypothetical protein
VSPLDPTTLGSRTPRTLDGRKYPEHLRAYEQYDEQLLPLLDKGRPLTFDDLSVQISGDRKLLAALPRWIASAEWRGLVERVAPAKRLPRRYVLGPRASSRAA